MNGERAEPQGACATNILDRLAPLPAFRRSAFDSCTAYTAQCWSLVSCIAHLSGVTRWLGETVMQQRRPLKRSLLSSDHKTRRVWAADMTDPPQPDPSGFGTRWRFNEDVAIHAKPPMAPPRMSCRVSAVHIKVLLCHNAASSASGRAGVAISKRFSRCRMTRIRIVLPTAST